MFGLIIERMFGGFWGFFQLVSRSRTPIVRMLYSAYMRSCGSHVGPTATFDSAPVLPHGLLGIFISGESSIGKNCVIFQGVTIGSNSIPGSKGRGAPIIGNNCYIGAGAKIVGAVAVGDNVRIGANCVVTRDVPDNSVVVLPAPTVIEREDIQDNRFYSRHNGVWVYFDGGKPHRVVDGSVLAALSS